MGDKSVWNLKLIHKWNPLSKFKRAGSYEVRESLIIPWKVSGSGRLELFMDRNGLGLRRTFKHHFYRLLVSTQAKPCLQPVQFQNVIHSPFYRGVLRWWCWECLAQGRYTTNVI